MTIVRFNPLAPTSTGAPLPSAACRDAALGGAGRAEPAPSARTPEARRTIAKRNAARRERQTKTPASRKAKAMVRVAEALERAQRGQSLANYPAIISGFAAKGIPEADIKPRENVLTYNAWLALGRRVRKGEHGVKVVTMLTTSRETTDAETGEVQVKCHRRPWSTTVFHVSQTDPVPQSPVFPQTSDQAAAGTSEAETPGQNPPPPAPLPNIIPFAPAHPTPPAWVLRVRQFAAQSRA